MKLSEAIFLGSKLRQQAFGTNFDGTGSCAFGAAMEAVGDVSGIPADHWDWIAKSQVCPVCGEFEKFGASVISVHLNDTHEWTREQIAEWVATVEPSGDPICALCSHPEGEHAAHGDWCPTPASEDQLFNYNQKFSSAKLSPVNDVPSQTGAVTRTAAPESIR